VTDRLAMALAVALFVAGLALSLSTLVPLSPTIPAAHAQEHGIFAEAAMAADGVTVRRIRDRETGIICYVARRGGPSDLADIRAGVAISCLRY